MKLRVQHEDGLIEVLTLVPPCEARLGRRMNKFTDATGMEYWFTEEGFYDGWSRDLSSSSVTEQQVNERIDQIEDSREIEGL